ncbi:colicin V production protein CvpA, partial [Staphylococcus cohnii]
KLSKMSRGIGVSVSILAASIYLVPLLYITSLYPNAWIQSQLTSSIIAKQLITQLPILSQFVVNI